MPAVLWRYHGDGGASCEDCTRDTIEANPGMNPADWLDDELGSTTCDSCDATVAPQQPIMWESLAHDFVNCECGNNVNADGFEYCSPTGEVIDPTVISRWSGHYYCPACKAYGKPVAVRA